MQEERERGLLFPLPKTSCMFLPPFLFLKWAACFCPFPPSQRELNKLCCTCLLRCESENKELERRLNSCKHEGSRGLKRMGNWRRRRNLKRGRGRGKLRAEGEKYCQTLPKTTRSMRYKPCLSPLVLKALKPKGRRNYGCMAQEFYINC